MILYEVNDQLENITTILGEYITGHKIDVKELPETVRLVLKKLNYNRREITIVPQEQVVLSSMGGKGYRAFAAVLDVSTGRHKIEYGSFGGPNIFTKNAVDSDQTPQRIPSNGAVILGSEGGGKPVYATIYVNPAMIAGFLPTEKDVVTKREKRILSVFRVYKGQTREAELMHVNAAKSEIDELIRRGLLGKTKNGNIAITSRGKDVSRYK